MRVLTVTHDHPFSPGSGVAAYCRDLDLELSRRGHDIYHLYSAERNWRMTPYLRWSAEQGITFASLVNSPVPSALSPEHPLQDCIQPQVESLFEKCLARAAPDLVHIHAFQGLCGSVLPLAKRHGLPVVLTLHDFWAMCARIVLVQVNGELCAGPEGGKNCARYCADYGPLRRRLYRRLLVLLPPGRGRKLVDRARSRLTRAMAGDHLLWASPDARVAKNGLGPLSTMIAHGARATFLLRLLEEADAILAVSDFVKQTFVRNGVPNDRVQVLRLGLNLPTTIEWRARQAHVPIRIGFLGRVVPLKGAHILAQAVRDIPPAKARVLFFGPASPDAMTDLQAAAGRPLEFRGPYRREDLARVLDEVDVVVVPTLFQETVGLAILEAQSAGLPVIATRIGAVPETIQEGQNGFLFERGNAAALRVSLLRFIERPELVAAMSARTMRPMTIGRHVDLLTDVYQRCLHEHRGSKTHAANPG